MDFLKADFIIGLTEIKAKYQKHITGHIHNSQGIDQNRPDTIFRAKTCKIYSIDIHYSSLGKLCSSQLLYHNEPGIELQIGPSSINKQ